MTSPGGVSLPLVTLFLLTFALALPTADNSQAPGPRISVVQDWTHRHLVFGGGGSLEGRIAAARNPRAVQQWLIRQQAWLQAQKDGGNNGLHLGRAKKQVDWAVSLGSTGGVSATMYPAKYSFSITTASCDDFMVFPVNAGGAGKASIVILDSLYSGGSTPTAGMCNTGNTTTPGANGPYNSGTGTYEARVWAAYTLPNPVTTSPVLSLDGAKVLVVDTVCNLHQITIPSDHSATYGSVASPATPTETSVSLGGAACTKSSPFVDYSTGAAYVGNDSGVLYKIPNAFGTPGTVTSNTVDSGHALLSPVVDSALQRVLVTTAYGKLCLVRADTLALADTCAQVGRSTTAGVITDPPLVDSGNRSAFVFGKSHNDSPYYPFVQQYTYAAAMLTARNTFNGGVAATNAVHVGAFDDNYYTSPTTGYLYFVTPRSGSVTQMVKIGFDAGPVLRPGAASSWTLPDSAAQSETSPLTEFKNGTDDRIFYSLLFTDGKVYSFSGGSFRTAGTTYPGGTSGIIVDNAVAQPHASSIYFGTLGTGACGTGNYCAVKLTQKDLL